MTKDEKLKALFDRFDNNIISDIQRQLDDELAKSDEDFNPDKIAELTAVIAEIKGGSLTEQRKADNIAKITDEVMANQKRSRINRIYKVLSVVCACLVIVIGMNIYTMNTFGDDLFSAAIKAAQNGFSLDFSGDSDENFPTESDFPHELPSTTTTSTYTDDCGTTVTKASYTSPATQIYEQTATNTCCSPTEIAEYTTTQVWATETSLSGEDNVSTTTTTEESCGDDLANISEYINDVCSSNGISVCSMDNSLMPAVLDAESEIEYTEYSTDIYFHFKGDNTKIDIIIENYYNKKDIPEMLIPSSNMDYDIISIPCGTAFLFTENGMTTAVFSDKSTVYTITGQSSENISDIVRNTACGFIPDKEN